MQIKSIKKTAHARRRLNAGSKTRVFVWPDESVMDNFQNRRGRPYKDWKPHVEQALTAFGISFERIGWSQKAGCSCPCSPGFVVYGDKPGFDLHVELEA